MNLNIICNLPDEHVTGQSVSGPITIADIKKNVALLPIPDLESRPIYIQPEIGADMPSNAVIVVGDSPFGKYDSMRASWAMPKNKAALEFKPVYCTSKKNQVGWNAVNKTDSTYTKGAPYIAWTEKNGKKFAAVFVFGIGHYNTPSYEAREDFRNGNTERRDRFMNFLDNMGGRISEVDAGRIREYVAKMDAATNTMKAVPIQAPGAENAASVIV